MGSSGAAGVVALAAGVAGAVQIGVMSRFGERVGVIEALAFSALVTAFVAGLTLLVARRSASGYADALHAPPWLWIGGVMSVVIVLGLTVAGPRVGVVATTGLLIVGQLAAAAVIDRFGLFGVERIGLSATKIAGLVLLAAGTALTLRK